MTVRTAKLRPAPIMLAAALFPSAMPTPAAAQGASPSVSYDIPEVASDMIHARVQAINARSRGR